MSRRLAPHDQRFLLNGYGPLATARALARGHDSSCLGGTGPHGAYDTNTTGIHYTLPDETRPEWRPNRPGSVFGRRPHLHTITWQALAAHARALPHGALDELTAAYAELLAESHRNWEALHAINPNVWWHATDEQQVALLTQERHHRTLEHAIEARIRAAVLAALPDSGDEPADLLEWAEALR